MPSFILSFFLSLSFSSSLFLSFVLTYRLYIYVFSVTDEEPVVNGHKIKLTNGGEPQKVFGQVDSNNVALTVHGPGSASVSSHIKQGSQTVIFDPSPYDPCPGKKCPQGNGTKRTKE